MRRKLLAGCRGDGMADGAQPLLPAVTGCNEHLFMIHTSHKMAGYHYLMPTASAVRYLSNLFLGWLNGNRGEKTKIPT